MLKGNLSLVDQLNGMQLAIQAAISEAFKTPEVIDCLLKNNQDSCDHDQHSSGNLKEFERVSADIGSGENVLAVAGSQVEKASK
ncbi:hypothetical protein Btru_022430 [Bulinus truncatus]|nr:hypothetical protein Btru_022430 [Bulinus truncatus]